MSNCNKTNSYPKIMLDILAITCITFLTWVLIRIIATSGISWDFLTVLKFIGYFVLFYIYPAAIILFNHIRIREKRLIINFISIVYLGIVIIRSIYLAIDRPVDDFEALIFIAIFAVLPIFSLVFNNRD